MKLSNTFIKTMRAYKDGFRFIINSGGSRSSKTYSTLQLLYLLAKRAKKKRIIHVISISIPHLRDGAITDFDLILQGEGENLDDVKIKTPYTYTIGKTTIRFIGADKIGGILGAQRDILFINEANNMKWNVVHQLIQRTTETVFIDYNPSVDFWVDQEGVSERDNAIVLNSTFLDNLDNLTDSQITEFQEGKKKHDDELSREVIGHWYNWWRVYGLGLKGRIESSIYNNWSIGEFDETLPIMYGIDFGFKDPFTLLKVAFDKSTMTIYLHEEIYKSNLAPNDIIQLLNTKIPNKDSLILADSADPTQIRGIKNDGFNIMGLGKEKIVIGIRHLQNWTFKVTPNSLNLIRELSNYIWLDKTGEVPIDNHNHCFTGETMITTSKGLKRIDKVTTSDKVLTREGFKPVLKTFDNGIKETSLYLMHFDTFTLSLRSTPNHKVKTNQGWKRIDSITEGMQLYLHKSLTGLHTTCTKVKSISAKQTKGCTEKYGAITTERYLKDTTFTTLTATQQTTQSKTYHLYSPACTLDTKERSGTRITQNGQRSSTQKELKQLKNGTEVKRVKNGIVKHQRNNGEKSNQLTRFVKSAAKTTKLKNQVYQSIVTKTVNSVHVLEESVKKERVYDLMVAEKHEYFANNILVHNCLDPLRYTEKFYRYKNS